MTFLCSRVWLFCRALSENARRRLRRKAEMNLRTPRLRTLVCLLLLVVMSSTSIAADPVTLIPWKPLPIPKALVVVGPWGDMFQWREGMHAQGLLYEEAYRAQNIYHGPTRLLGLPESPQKLNEFSVVVIANVEAEVIPPVWMEAIERFVQQGGGLVVLGGQWAYHRGGYTGTKLEAMLPVTMPVENRIPSVLEGDVLAPHRESKWSWKFAFEKQPRSFYTQKLVPKDGAQIELQAGDKPALVSGSFGKGRVVACALTVHGKSTPEALGFWEWSDWPKVLGQACDWAAGNRPIVPAGTAGDDFKPLSEDEIRSVQLAFQPLTDDFIKRFAAAPNAAAAQAIVDRVFAGDLGKVTITPAVDGLIPFAKPEHAKGWLKHADDLNPNTALRNAAVELLGATQSPEAGPALIKLLNQSENAALATDGLRRLGDPAHVEAIKRVYDRSVKLADFRHPGGVGVTAADGTRNGILATHAAAALYVLGEPHGTERMASLFREIRLLRRIMANAAKRRVGDTDTQGQAIRKAIIDKWTDFARLEQFLHNIAGPISDRQRDAFIEFANKTTDDSEVLWLSNALLRSPTSKNWLALKEAQDGILRRLGIAKSK